MAKRKRVRCRIVLDAKGKRLIRCKNPAKHHLPDGTPLCTVHWRMSAEGKHSRGCDHANSHAQGHGSRENAAGVTMTDDDKLIESMFEEVIETTTKPEVLR